MVNIYLSIVKFLNVLSEGRLVGRRGVGRAVKKMKTPEDLDKLINDLLYG
jgi:hypothetical protein